MSKTLSPSGSSTSVTRSPTPRLTLPPRSFISLMRWASLERDYRESSADLNKQSSLSETNVQHRVDSNMENYSETHSSQADKYVGSRNNFDNDYRAGQEKSDADMQAARDKRDISKRMGLDDLIKKLKE